jgi:drug/metabolite transporter (DMT)-like permease
MNTSVACALVAALLFGASTPFAKLLLGNMPPLLLAGLLYAGSGIGLFITRLIRDGGWQSPRMAFTEWLWLLCAIAFGGVFAPAALMIGLVSVNGSTASLLLNLESVLTALLAWVIFKEHTNKRMVLGMAVIVAGSVLLTVSSNGGAQSVAASRESLWGVVAIAVACLCWAIDNNLTRKVSSSDALFIASSKGWVAGAVNISLACYFGASIPEWRLTLASMAVGFLGYGISLVLFILALRGLGTARTGAYFSIAPFAGTALSLVLLHEPTTMLFWLATTFMALGVWLHLTEHHEHEHEHVILGQDPIRHSHPHYPDVDHQHAH